MTGSPGGVVFLFSTEGGAHDRMGRTLAGRYPAFATAVTAACDAVLAAGGPQVWTPRYGFRNQCSAPPPNGRHGDPGFTQPALFAYQIATATLLISWGVRPDAVIGHGAGEIAAAVTAGALSLEDGATVAVARGRSANAVPNSIVVAELLTSVPEVTRLVEPVRNKVVIAAVHGPGSVLISGAPRYVDAVLRRAERRDITVRSIPDGLVHGVPSAAIPELFSMLDNIEPAVPDIPMYSTVRPGTVIDTAATTAQYWVENFTGRVELDAAMRGAARSGGSIVLEVGPDPILADAARALPQFAHTTYPTARREDEGTAFLTCLAQVQVIRAPESAVLRSGRYAGRTAGNSTNPSSSHLPHQYENHSPGIISEDHRAAVSTDRGRTDEQIPTNSKPGGGGHPESAAQKDLRAEVTEAATLASIRPADNLPPTDIIAWTRMVDANRAIRFLAGRVAVDPPMRIDAAGTYVVSGGLGALGSVTVRRLLVAGARDVLVPTRSPRPVPPLLEGFEDRVVVVRCDTADRSDLDNALRDIRESGCTIRGVVHAAQVFEDTVVAAVAAAENAAAEQGSESSNPVQLGDTGSLDRGLDAGRLARRFARISSAAANLIELTAADPVAFFAVFTTPFGGPILETSAVPAQRWMNPAGE